MHRVSGVVLFLALPFALYLLERSLSHPAGFDAVSGLLNRPVGRLMLLAVIVSLALHVFAGIRHLALDVHWGVGKNAARQSAIWVLIATLLVVLLAGWRMFP